MRHEIGQNVLWEGTIWGRTTSRTLKFSNAIIDKVVVRVSTKNFYGTNSFHFFDGRGGFRGLVWLWLARHIWSIGLNYVACLHLVFNDTWIRSRVGQEEQQLQSSYNLVDPRLRIDFDRDVNGLDWSWMFWLNLERRMHQSSWISSRPTKNKKQIAGIGYLPASITARRVDFRAHFRSY